MSASDYAINFPYGSTSAPYSASSPHRGNDRPCPTGTPIVIAGQTIGLTGATGKVTGPHLHIQEWNNGYANTRKPQNEFKAGTVVNIDPNGTQGDGSFGKFITIQTSDGWNDTYCHLSRIDVKIGQVIGGITMTDGQIADWISKEHYIAYGKPASDAVFKDWGDVLRNNPIDGALSILGGVDNDPDALKNKPQGGDKYEKVEVYRKIS